jgi:hypothetical protein
MGTEGSHHGERRPGGALRSEGAARKDFLFTFFLKLFCKNIDGLQILHF